MFAFVYVHIIGEDDLCLCIFIPLEQFFVEFPVQLFHSECGFQVSQCGGFADLAEPCHRSANYCSLPQQVGKTF